MPSEYDFLFPYSRRLRRAGSVLMAVGAFLAGAVCMAVVIALPLWTIGKDDTGAHTASVNTEQAARTTPVAASPAEPACEAHTWPHIDRNCPRQKQSETQRSVVGPEKPGNKPAESAGSPSDQGGEVAAVERQTTGLAASTSKPADAGPAAPAPAAADPKPPVPAAEAPAPRGRTQALNVERPADDEGTAATNREAPGATRSGKSTEKPAAAPDRRRARSNRTYASRHPARLERTRGDRRDGAREFVDAYGVRHIILPRRWSERAYDVPATVYDRPARATRVIVVRPAPYDDD
jgi:hypothetical protein